MYVCIYSSTGREESILTPIYGAGFFWSEHLWSNNFKLLIIFMIGDHLSFQQGIRAIQIKLFFSFISRQSQMNHITGKESLVGGAILTKTESCMHPLVRDLYRRVLLVGRDYPHPEGMSYVRRTWKAALRNPENVPSFYRDCDDGRKRRYAGPSRRDGPSCGRWKA